MKPARISRDRNSLKSYSVLFFDLDHTLWDFEANSREALKELLHRFDLDAPFEDFEAVYSRINQQLWQDYREGKIEKTVLSWMRFYQTFEAFGIHDEALAQRFGDAYVQLSPRKCQLMPHTLEVLDYLQGKYPMYIITNGFEEVQYGKLANCGLGPFFNGMITSERAGVRKPDRAIFDLSVKEAGQPANACLMIGDDQEVDIEGARQAGMDQVFYNYRGEINTSGSTWEISCLRELIEIL